jgi:hypothetical protein
MSAWQMWAALMTGVAIGLAIPTRLIHEWGKLMRIRAIVWLQEHVIAAVLVGLIVGVLAVSLAFLGFGYALSSSHEQTQRLAHDEQALKDQAHSTARQFAAYKACVNEYARKSHAAQTARSDAAQALQDAQQKVTDDNTVLWHYVAQSLDGTPVPPDVANKVLGQYLADAAKEQHLAQQLTRARETNPIPNSPKVACP